MTDESLDLVWGAANIAKFLNLKNRRKAYYMLESGKLPARKVGQEWVASRGELRRHLMAAANEAAA